MGMKRWIAAAFLGSMLVVPAARGGQYFNPAEVDCSVWLGPGQGMMLESEFGVRLDPDGTFDFPGLVNLSRRATGCATDDYYPPGYEMYLGTAPCVLQVETALSACLTDNMCLTVGDTGDSLWACAFLEKHICTGTLRDNGLEPTSVPPGRVKMTIDYVLQGFTGASLHLRIGRPAPFFTFEYDWWDLAGGSNAKAINVDIPVGSYNVEVEIRDNACHVDPISHGETENYRLQVEKNDAAVTPFHDLFGDCPLSVNRI